MKIARAIVIELALMLVLLAGYLVVAPDRMYDFRAFYCAGKAVAAHADPYREHPLHECERSAIAPGISIGADTVTVPAPLPGYALAVFWLLAQLPFGLSALIWIVGSLAALAASIELLRGLTRLPRYAIAVAVGLPAAVVAIPLGQSASFVGLGIAGCAYGLAAARPRLAACAALVTALDPAIALVLCTTLLIAVPATRRTIAFGTAALALLSVLTLGIDVNSEYFGAVLHAHAVGNVAERSQFSATHFAWVAGLRSDAALVLGNAWYGCAALAGIYVALRLKRRFGSVALAFVPPAFAVYGGMYVHYSQLVLAIPAFLMLLSAQRSRRVALPAAIFVLAVPWIALPGFPPAGIALVILARRFTRNLPWAQIGTRLGAACAALVCAYFLVALMAFNVAMPAFERVFEQNPLAEAGWSQYVAWRDPTPNLVYLFFQIPTVIAFTIGVAALVRSAFGLRKAGADVVYKRSATLEC